MKIENYWADILVEGTDSADSIYNYHGGDNITIDAKNGDNYIYNAANPAVIITGNGDDTYVGAEGGYNKFSTIDMGDGNDSLYVGSGISTGSMLGGNGNDTIDSHNVWYLVIDSGDNDDLIINDRGYAQSVFGGNGNDTLQLFTDVECTVNGDDGNDIIDIMDSRDSVNSGTGNDTITVSRQALEVHNINDLTIAGGKDDDLIKITLDGEEEDNKSKILIIYNSGDGNDTIFGFDARSSLNITADYFKETIGNDVLFTVGEGFILLKDAASEDDIKVIGKQASIVSIQDDSYYRVKITDKFVVTVDAGERSSAIYLEANDNNNVVYGGQGNDTILGMNGNDKINGQRGNDVLYGNKGKDTLYGSYGNDTLWGGDNNDKLYGNSGHDIIYGESGKDYIDGGTGDDIINSGSNNDTVYGGTGNDSIKGWSGDDIIYGGTGNDSLHGGYGNDSIFGNEDNDRIDGSYGDDIIHGGIGDDTLKGGSGNDTLWGDTGTDKLWGGTGSDVFVYRQDSGKTYIYDWEETDMLQILDYEGKEVTFTNSSFKNGSLTLAIEGGGHVIFKNVTSYSQFNINGTIHTITGRKLG